MRERRRVVVTVTAVVVANGGRKEEEERLDGVNLVRRAVVEGNEFEGEAEA